MLPFFTYTAAIDRNAVEEICLSTLVDSSAHKRRCVQWAATSCKPLSKEIPKIAIFMLNKVEREELGSNSSSP